MNAGEMQSGSMNSPTQLLRLSISHGETEDALDDRTLSSIRALVLGSLQSTLCYQQVS